MSLQIYGEDDFADLETDWPPGGDGGPLFASYPWLAAFRGRMEGDHRWYVASDEHGSSGLMATILAEDITSEAKNPRRLLTESCRSLRGSRRIEDIEPALERGRPPTEGWLPALVVLYPGFECYPARCGKVSTELLGELVDGVLEDADRAGCATVSFLFVPGGEDDFTAVLRDRNLIPFYAATSSTLALPGNEYGDYLDALDRRQRADARKQEAELAKAGVTVAEEPLLQEALDELTALRLDDRRKHGRRLDEVGERRMLSTMAGPLSDRVRLTTARRYGEVLAFSIMLAAEDRVEHAWTQAVSLDADHRLALYLTCTYYAAIRGAYARGVDTIDYGYGTDRLKRLRGCRETEMNGWFLSGDRRTTDYVRSLADTALRVGEIR